MFMELLLGIPLGILASLLAWYILFHVIQPSIGFYGGVSKHEYENSGSYRIKFENIGNRTIIDLEVFIRFRVRGIGRFKKNWNIAELETSVKRLPILIKGGDRIVRIFPDKTEIFLEERWGQEINDRYNAGCLSLEDILTLGEKSQLRVYVFGFDEFSGSRRLFRSKWYQLEDICLKTFKEMPIEYETNRLLQWMRKIARH